MLRRFRKTILILASGLFLVVPGLNQAVAQVVFEVSSESKQLVRAKFSDGELIKALEDGKVKPEEVFRIYVGVKEPKEIGDRSAILGAYEIIPGQIVFKPWVPFSEQLPYLAVFRDSVVYPFQFASPANRPRTKLLAIYPSSDAVPANLLKIYLRFSGPMREGEVYDRVRIYDQDDELVKNPLVPLRPELWDSSGQVVTLWLDPGRVKRALLARETHGPVLEEGRSYLLTVDSLWKDAHGQLLEVGFSKQFSVVTDDRIKPEVNTWHLTVPKSGTMDPLIITFGEAMDQATSQHAFSVWNLKKEKLAGITGLDENEKSLEFRPDKNWLSGTYRLRIYAKLEDLAGNNLNRVFDRDLSSNSETPSNQEFHWIEFNVSEGL